MAGLPAEGFERSRYPNDSTQSSNPFKISLPQKLPHGGPERVPVDAFCAADPPLDPVPPDVTARLAPRYRPTPHLSTLASST
jgi:hypothetical protein